MANELWTSFACTVATSSAHKHACESTAVVRWNRLQHVRLNLGHRKSQLLRNVVYLQAMVKASREMLLHCRTTIIHHRKWYFVFHILNLTVSVGRLLCHFSQFFCLLFMFIADHAVVGYYSTTHTGTEYCYLPFSRSLM